jgi:hypothetical protein
VLHQREIKAVDRKQREVVRLGIRKLPAVRECFAPEFQSGKLKDGREQQDASHVYRF